MEKIKIVFFGTPQFPIAPLEALVKNNYQIEAVVTNVDKPKGRQKKGKKRRSVPPPLKEAALKHGLKVLQPQSLRLDKQFMQQIKDIGADLFILSAYAKIIPKEYIDIPRLGTINIHPSLLPQYRGPTPIEFSILNGDKKTGVTLILLDEKFDHGPVITQEEYQLTGKEKFQELHDNLSNLAADLLIKTLPDWIDDKIEAKEQDHSKATYTRIFERKDGEIDWTDPAIEIERKIRALNPRPGTHSFVTLKNGSKKMLKIFDAEAVDIRKDTEPANVYEAGGDVLVQAGEGALKLKEVQLESKGRVSIKEFVNGNKEFIGITMQGYRD